MTRELALTFDDGPGPSTSRLLDVLASHGARATFFLLGRNLAGEALGGDAALAESITARMLREGHALGNHTVTHVAPLTLPVLLDEVSRCDRLLAGIAKHAGMPLHVKPPIRLPFGPFRSDGEESVKALDRLGRPHCHWTGDAQDWRPDRTADQIAATMRRQIERDWRAGRLPVLLLHDAAPAFDPGGVRREATIEAVEQICAELADEGVRFLTANQCPPAALRYRALVRSVV